jgi:hypothetical protein
MVWYKIHLSFTDSIDNKTDSRIVDQVSDFALRNNLVRNVTIYSDQISKQGLTLFVKSDNQLILDLLRKNYNLQQCPEPDTQGLIHCYGVVS